ncbi:uncharacterized protein LOC134286182 [Aedes albopictus]|uniref:Reverse transcriptase domain-containing protein n=1 Tax=Aedes albopictus TaxID=7160 RepID=A0ABM1XPP0_AEDAL
MSAVALLAEPQKVIAVTCYLPRLRPEREGLGGEHYLVAHSGVPHPSRCRIDNRHINGQNSAIKKQVATCIQNYLARSHSHNDPLTTFCKHASIATMRFLAEHEDICVLKSDKGRRMVIMYQQDYERKMLSLLEDDTYNVVARDPTTGIQKCTNALVKRLYNLQLIDIRTKYRLQFTTAVCPRIYGQPKTHKPDLPLRPVVPNVTAPAYQLSKFLADVLQRSAHSEYNIKDSFEFAEYIRNITLPTGYVLVSFDVISLFTNIPQQLMTHDLIMGWDKLLSLQRQVLRPAVRYSDGQPSIAHPGGYSDE